jgi:tetratricopeptide (TPR) repeat protein
MSLLLDALKRAAQEKLEKQRREESGADENGTTPVGEVLSLDIADAPRDSGEARDAGDLRLDTLPDSGTDLRMHRADVLASELQAFMGGNPTERRGGQLAGETPEKKAENLARPFAETAAPTAVAVNDASPAAAARLFRNKRSGIRSKRGMLIVGGTVALLLTVLFYVLHLNSLDRSNVRLDRLRAAVPAAPVTDAPPAARAIEKRLLAEQEAIDALLDRAPHDPGPSTSVAGDQAAQSTNLFAGDPPPRQTSAENPAAPDTPRTARRAGTGSGTRSAVPRLSVRKSDQEALHEVLLRAYKAYEGGDIVTAEAEYRRALARAPRNRDALLGFAATAIYRGDYVSAMESYTTLLGLDPNDDLALAGIAGLKQQAPGMTPDESQIKRLLLKRPDSAQLHFALGNLYSAAADWPKAQNAYFDAHRHDSRNPDYAYNLAVSLEHLRQPAQALRYYQLALTLAGGRAPNFDSAQAAARVAALQAQTQDTTGHAR